MAKIIVTLKDKDIDEIPLDEKVVTIGRDSKNTIHLKNPSVSREHARIMNKGGVYYIDDLGSKNGTYINGSMVTWRSGLNDNDEITIGKYTLVFKETAKGKKKKSEKLIPEFIDSTIKLPKK